jgi:hypothetical protein
MRITVLLALASASVLAANSLAAPLATNAGSLSAVERSDAIAIPHVSSGTGNPSDKTTLSVLGTGRVPRPQMAELVAERNAAAEAGDLELAYDIECRLQAVYQELRPLEGVHYRYESGPGEVTMSKGKDPDVTIGEGRFLATAADYELGGPMWVTAFNQEDTAAHLYVSHDHGETWEEPYWWATDPRQDITPLGCVVGEGDSLFVYCFYVDPRGTGGDLMCLRWNPATGASEFLSVLAGPDTVTDFAVCRDYKGSDYWLYAIAANELGPANAVNDLILRSTDYGLTWAVLDTFRYVQNPHLSASAGSWMFMSIEIGPEFPGNHNVIANSWFWSPDTMWWESMFSPDTFEVHDVVVAPSFTEPADSATLWMVYAYNRENSGDWNIKYRWSPVLWPDWTDTLVLAGHPDYDEYFPDIRSYTFAGNAWMNACYVTEGPSFRAVQRRHVHASTPTDWSEPLTINTTSAGTGSDVKPKLCYSPGASGTGAGAVFTGAGLTNLYWNAPWHAGAVAEERTHLGLRPSQTICRGVLRLAGKQGAVLYDLTGREAKNLVPGENDIGEIAPGVYFVVGGAAADSRRVVIQR